MTTTIDQKLTVALQAGTKNNIFVYHAPQATVSNHQISKGVREEYNGALQMLYAICTELLEQGMTDLLEWKILSRRIMLLAAVHKYGSKAAAARELGLSGIDDTMEQLEHLEV